jgi:hypothetical protein
MVATNDAMTPSTTFRKVLIALLPIYVFRLEPLWMRSHPARGLIT